MSEEKRFSREERKEYLRGIASVNEILQAILEQDSFLPAPRELVAEAVRSVVESVRQAILTAEEVELEEIKTGISDLIPLVEKAVHERLQPSLRRVVNATGVVVHTNLGRSILAQEAVEEISAVVGAYSNLEYDLEKGGRGLRRVHVEELLRELTGAEAALVVNNNAAAVLLALTAHAVGREVIVGRGQLVEIGGSFRLPDVLAQSGARLVEVGTTNKTYISDYREAISADTAAIMRTHTSNYRIVGFTAEPELSELAELAHQHGIILIDDLGSGVLLDLGSHGIPGEPTVEESLKAGSDLVCFSGDKLLGGPQAGIALGRESLIEAMATHPLARALRSDKLTLAGLEATLRLYREPAEALKKIPTLAMLTQDLDSLKKKARRLATICRRASSIYTAEVVEDISRAGGGALPLTDLPTAAVALSSTSLSANELAEGLRKAATPVIARIKEGRLLLDVRTLLPEDFHLIGTALEELASKVGGAREP